MEDAKYKYIVRTYHIFCLVVAITLTSWCIYEYSMDRDVTEIRLRKFHETKEDIHPSITICSLNPFWEEKYRTYIKNHPAFNAVSDSQADAVITDYKNLLHSEKNWLHNIAYKYKNESSSSINQLIDRLHGIDYDSSTLSLKDFVSKFHITVPISSEELAYIHYDVLNDTNVIANNKSNDIQLYSLQEMKIINIYTSARQPYYKCFTIDTPLQLQTDIREVSIKLNTSIFSYGLSLSQFYFTLTYPKQFIRTPIGSRIVIPKSVERLPQCYKYEIHVGSMKVFKRRNKSQSPCNSDCFNHDKKQLNEIIRNIGCKPIHWKQTSNFPDCTKPNEYTKINQQIYQRNEFMPPCRSIEKLAKTTRGFDLGIKCLRNSYLDLKFYLDEEIFYEEVVLVPAYDIQHLVGNAGKIYDTSIRK